MNQKKNFENIFSDDFDRIKEQFKILDTFSMESSENQIKLSCLRNNNISNYGKIVHKIEIIKNLENCNEKNKLVASIDLKEICLIGIFEVNIIYLSTFSYPDKKLEYFNKIVINDNKENSEKFSCFNFGILYDIDEPTVIMAFSGKSSEIQKNNYY